MSTDTPHDMPETAPDRPDGGDAAAALKAEIEALKDKSLRALAEMENLRKRGERERSEASQYAIARFARDVLTVADNLARALGAAGPDKRQDMGDAARAIVEGVEATERELQAMLARHGVKAIEAQGARFDPNLHQAIAEVPGSGQPSGTVVDVVQGGYTIGERLLRPAMVTVARAGESPANGSGGALDTTA